MCPSPDKDRGQENEKLRVLVVDDEPTLRLGFAYALTSRTSSVETAATGRQALDKIAEIRFDIMILDLRMPEMDGIGVIETLRAERNSIPIVLCSAAFHAGAALRAIRCGVVDFLLKPVRPIDLRQVLEFVLRPNQTPFQQAMKAIRLGKNAEAMRLLESDGDPCRQSKSWLRTLGLIRDGHPTLEETLDADLANLAFNTPAFP
jgi:CheY-like chemotaxis protein